VFLVVALLPFLAAAKDAVTAVVVKDQAGAALTWTTAFANCKKTYVFNSVAATSITVTATFGAGTLAYSWNAGATTQFAKDVASAALTLNAANSPSPKENTLVVTSDTDGVYTFTFVKDGTTPTITALEFTDNTDAVITMTPAWSSGKIAVAPWGAVAGTITGIKVKATFATGTAKLNVGGGTDVALTTATATAAQTIAAGQNSITVTGSAGEVYMFTIIKAGTVSALAFKDQAGTAITLVPAFVAGLTSYTASVAETATAFKVTGTFSGAAGTLKAKVGTLAEVTLATAVEKEDATNFALAAQTATAPATTTLTLTSDSDPKTITVTFSKRASTAISTFSLKDSTDAAVSINPAWARDTLVYTAKAAVTATRIKPTIKFATGVKVKTVVQPACLVARTAVDATSDSEVNNAVNDLSEDSNLLMITTDNGDGPYAITVTKGGSSTASSTSLSVVALVLSVVLSVVAIWA